jgi:type I restriction enzyme M protein
LPTGIFYSPGVKTNVLFFSRGENDLGNTETVWVYDMRHDAPKNGKKRPLRVEDFSDFISAFGDDPTGGSLRIDDGPGSRWRSFSRADLNNRNENLDITWLSGSELAEADSLTEPEDITAAILDHLRVALLEIEGIAIELAESAESVE